MNEFLTAYLYGLYAVRRGAISAADSMSHVLDLMAMARGAKDGVERAMAFGARATGMRDPARREGRRWEPDA